MGAASDDLDAPHDPESDPVRDPDRDLAQRRSPVDGALSGPDAGPIDEPVPFDLGEGDIATRIAHARRRHGRAGGMLAAGMLGIDQVVNGRKPREDAPIVVAANSDPIDIDRDGISVPLDPDDPDGQFAVAAPPLPRRDPIVAPRSSGRRRWR